MRFAFFAFVGLLLLFLHESSFSQNVSIESFSLINSDTNQEVMKLTPGSIVSLIEHGRNLNIKANTSPSKIGSVKFYLNDSNLRTESAAPYAAFGDSSGNFKAWRPSEGKYTIKAIPYSKSSASGSIGPEYSVSFEVRNEIQPEYEENNNEKESSPNSNNIDYIAINAGGEEHISIDGVTFLEDQYFINGKTHVVSKPINNTDEDTLFMSERWANNLSYEIPINKYGAYEVKLHFSEIYWSNNNQRTFDVLLEGNKVLNDFDVFKESGGQFNAITKVFNNINVDDGILNIDLIASRDNAKLSAIEVIYKGSVKDEDISSEHDNNGLCLVEGLSDDDARKKFAAKCEGIPVECGPVDNGICYKCANLSIHRASMDCEGNLINGDLNQPPNADNFSDTKNEDDTLTFSLVSSDSDGDELEYNIPGVVSGDDGNTYTVNNIKANIFNLLNSEYQHLKDGEEVNLSFNYSVEDGNGGADSANINITIKGKNDKNLNNQKPIRINVGGNSFSYNNVLFLADVFYSGGSTSSTNDNIGSTSADTLFKTERYGKSFSYNIPIENGDYKVALGFAEIYWLKEGMRLFDVKIENGAGVLSNVEPFEEAGGHDEAFVKIFDVNVDDGVLNIDLNVKYKDGQALDNAQLAYIEVLNSNSQLTRVIDGSEGDSGNNDEEVERDSDNPSFPEDTNGGTSGNPTGSLTFDGLYFYESDGTSYPDVTYAGLHQANTDLPHVATVKQNTGNDRKAFQDAVDEVSRRGGGAIKVPRGTYTFNDGFVEVKDSNISFFGETTNPDDTLIKMNTTSGYSQYVERGAISFVGGDAPQVSSNSLQNNDNNLLRDTPIGSNLWYPAKISNFQGSVGDYVITIRKNWPSWHVYPGSVYNVAYARNVFKIIEVGSNYFKTAQPARFHYSSGSNSKALKVDVIKNVGIENISMTYTGSDKSHDYSSKTSFLSFKGVVNYWVRNMKFLEPKNQFIFAHDSKHGDIRNSHFEGGWNRTSGQGNSYVGCISTHDTIYENNDIIDIRHFVYQMHSSGCVGRNNKIKNADLNYHMWGAGHNLTELTEFSGEMGRKETTFFGMWTAHAPIGAHRGMSSHNIVWNNYIHSGKSDSPHNGKGGAIVMGGNEENLVVKHTTFVSENHNDGMYISLFGNSRNTLLKNNVFWIDSNNSNKKFSFHTHDKSVTNNNEYRFEQNHFYGPGEERPIWNGSLRPQLEDPSLGNIFLGRSLTKPSLPSPPPFQSMYEEQIKVKKEFCNLSRASHPSCIKFIEKFDNNSHM